MASDIFDKVEISKQEDIFDTLAYGEEVQAPTEEDGKFKKIAKETLGRGATGFAEGLLGTYGDILDMLGLQSPESVQPGQEEIFKAQHEASPEQLPFLDDDDDLMPRYGRLPSGKDIKKILGMLGAPTEKPESIPAKIAEGAGKGVGAALSFGGGQAGRFALGGGVGAAVESITGSPILGSLTDLGVTITRPEKILEKGLSYGKKIKDFVKSAKKIGLSEKQITPLIQSEKKLSYLAKFAHKGEAQEKLLIGIEDTLGDAYKNLTKTKKDIPPLAKKYADKLDTLLHENRVLSKKIMQGGKAKDIAKAKSTLDSNIKGIGFNEGKLTKLTSEIEKTFKTPIKDFKKAVSPYQDLSKKDSSKLSSSINKVVKDLQTTVSTIPEKQTAIDFLDKSSKIINEIGTNPKELIGWYQDIGSKINWTKDGEKYLAAVQKPIVEALKSNNPKLAKEFIDLNTLYSKFKSVSKHLSPKTIDKYLKMGKIGTVALSLGTGHPAGLATLLGVEAGSRGMTELLTNPRFQSMSRKLLKSITDDKTKSALSLTRQIIKLAKEKQDQ